MPTDPASRLGPRAYGVGVLWALAILTTLVALANWSTRRPGRRDGLGRPWGEWLTKPAVTAGLIAIAASIDALDATQRVWCLVGLSLCLCGDVALMWRPELFRTGLVSFLLGHLAFVVGFVSRGELAPSWAIAVGVVVIVGCLGIAAGHLMPSIRRTAPELVLPVSAYVLVIATMVGASSWGGHWAAPLGAATFAISDLTLADDKFVTHRRWSSMAVMITYHGALALLVASLA